MNEGKEWEKKANNLDRKWYILVAINVSFSLYFFFRFCDNIGNEFMYARFWGQKLTMLLNSIHTATAATKRALNIMNSFPVYSLDWSSLNCKFLPSHTFHFIHFLFSTRTRILFLSEKLENYARKKRRRWWRAKGSDGGGKAFS